MIRNIVVSLCLCLCFQIAAQAVQSPKLVVVINIDELQTDHILALRNKFGKNGFNRLLAEGTYFSSANYGTFSAYQGSKRATMLTGTYPSKHGIISDKWFLQGSKKTQSPYVFTGNDNFSHPDSGIISNSRINCATISDELLLFSRNKSKVAAIGINPSQVVYNVGHKYNNLYWFDRTTGQMVTQANDSLPKWANTFNDHGFPQKYVTSQWGPSSDIRDYHEYLGEENPQIRHFLYDLNQKSSKTPFDRFSGSPDMNVLLRDFSVSMLLNEDFGKDEFTDFLSLNFTCKPKGPSDEENNLLCAEQEDMLLRLDKEIASFLKVLETQIGTEHTLVVLTSTPTNRHSPERMKEQGLEVGTFNGQKSSALLNLYLMALHGQGKWVLGYHDRQFYLNHELIKKEGLKLADLRLEASDFLLDVSGIDKTISGSLLRTNTYSSGIFKEMQNSYAYNRSGDIMISFFPGWSEELRLDTYNNYSINYNIKVPLIFWGGQIRQKTVSRNIQMIDVAATLSELMQIPTAEGNNGEPLRELMAE